MSEESAASGADGIGRLGAPARALLVRAAGADARARAVLRSAIDDALLNPDARLDERTRAALGALLSALVSGIAARVAAGASASLPTQGRSDLTELFDEDYGSIVERLADAGLLRDSDLMGECIARVRTDLMAAALPIAAPDVSGTPSLIVRLTESRDQAVAQEARRFMALDARRVDTPSSGALPNDLYERLLWWTAAALRERAVRDASVDHEPLDRVIAQAALDDIALYRDEDRAEDAAMRLAEAIDAEADELPALIEETLLDGQLTLFVAMIAQALGTGHALARDIVIDPLADRLVLVLRALEVPRDAIARIGVRLSQADPRRDLDALADALDAAMGMAPHIAREAVAPLRLHPGYRAALVALEGGR